MIILLYKFYLSAPRLGLGNGACGAVCAVVASVVAKLRAGKNGAWRAGTLALGSGLHACAG